jgi:hypothetical protein
MAQLKSNHVQGFILIILKSDALCAQVSPWVEEVCGGEMIRDNFTDEADYMLHLN